MQEYCLKYLQLIMAALPNFFPHLYNIYQEILSKGIAFKTPFKLFIDEKELLGIGSNGTIVCKGKFQGRSVAIKKAKKSVSKAVEREMSILLKIDKPNILQYITKEEDDDFIYIGMELCECNLATFVRDQGLSQEMKTTILQQLAKGLSYLHQLNISNYSNLSFSVSKFILTFQFTVTSNRKIF